jgi:hypothetical protein
VEAEEHIDGDRPLAEPEGDDRREEAPLLDIEERRRVEEEP